MEKYLEGVTNLAVLDSLMKAKAILGRHFNIVASISGGSDSDIVLDICEKVRGNKEVKYVWFNTGLEYQATKDHLDYLEKRYGVKIEWVEPVKPIPLCVKQYGVPFISKRVSEFLELLLHHGFEFKDEPYEILAEKYPKIKSAVKWWCNYFNPGEGFKTTMKNINHHKWLKEFLIENPPTFPISAKCCTYAKKKPAKIYKKQSGADLEIIGVRKSEGGVRAVSYKNCFTAGDDGLDQYRPVFFMKDEDKEYYENRFQIVHSDCYTKYGFKRTGCVGCPYNRNVLNDLEMVKEYEPKMYKACMNIFGKAYEYTKQYREFCTKKNAEEKKNPDQPSLFDIGE